MEETPRRLQSKLASRRFREKRKQHLTDLLAENDHLKQTVRRLEEIIAAYKNPQDLYLAINDGGTDAG